MKRAVVTGATGAIGVALINELIKNHIEVLVLCRKGSARNSNIPKHPLVHLDFCDLESYSTYRVNDSSYDVLYHLAWMGTTGAARNDMYLQNSNVRYSLDAVQLAKRLGCRRFIGIGSQAEYGCPNILLSPTTNTIPKTGYGIAKLTAGLMTKQFCCQLGLEHIWVRVLSIYGPYDWDGSLIMSTIQGITDGNELHFTKGEQLWDYLYSDDAAEALRLIAERGSDGKTYILSSGKTRPLKDYINEIKTVIGKEVDLHFGDIPYSPDQIMYLCGDISETVRDTGWNPQTDFCAGIQNIINRNRLKCP